MESLAERTARILKENKLREDHRRRILASRPTAAQELFFRGLLIGGPVALGILALIAASRF